MRAWASVIAAALLLLSPAARAAQGAPPPPTSPAAPAADPGLTTRIAQLPALLRGDMPYAAYFAPIFIADVAEARFRTLVAGLVAAHGPVVNVEGVTIRNPHGAEVRLGFARGIATVGLSVEPAAPHRVTGLRFLTVLPRNDGAAALSADFAALPGRHALLVRELGADTAPILARNADAAGAQASTFKLWLLAEAARGVAAGERRWTDIVPLVADVPSSPVTGGWPAATPLTLQAAAQAMIARSDNRATDSLMAVLGRAPVSTLAARLGADRRGLPLLSTREAFAIKFDPARTAAWCAPGTTAAARDRLLATDARAIARFDFTTATQPPGPMAIDCVEWFASAAAMAATLDALRLHGGPVVAGILSVNPGVGRPVADRFAWLGYKGGSEPGVMAMTFLVRTRANRWFAASGWWNDPAAPVDDARFVTLMERALTLIPAD